MPKVSVILTSFNHAKYICEAIDSVLNQTFTDFELIIVDDCSSDDSWHLINQYSDLRIRAFRSEVNKGPVEGVNKAISEVVTGEYIAIHHSDDVWELDKLERQVAFLDANLEIGAVFTNALAIAEDGSPLADAKHFYANIFEQPNRTRQEWLRFFFSIGNALCHPSVLIRKSCYEDCGLYRYGFAQVADFDMWIRLCMKYEIHVMSEKLVRYRVRDNEANTSGNRPETRIRSAYEVYKLLDNYKKIASFEDMRRIFPNADRYDQNKTPDLCFILAMVALEEKPSTFVQLFCQDILFDAISDPKRAANIRQSYNFGSKSFIALTAQHDVFLLEEVRAIRGTLAERDGQIASLNHAVAEREDQIYDLSRALEEIRGSIMWRVTAPLRAVPLTVRIVRSAIVLLPQLLQKQDGLWSTTCKAVRIFRNEGISGVKTRIRRVRQQAAIATSVSQAPTSSETSAELTSKPAVVPYYIDPKLDSVAAACSTEVSIAVHLHLYYTEMLKEFVSYL